jgi:hypothetical protein
MESGQRGHQPRSGDNGKTSPAAAAFRVRCGLEIWPLSSNLLSYTLHNAQIIFLTYCDSRAIEFFGENSGFLGLAEWWS